MSSPEPVVLGIWDGHDASVALVVGGSLVFALSEERPTRRKRYSGFPHRALAAALAFAEAEALDITDVAFAGRWGRLPLRALEPLYARSGPARDELGLASSLVRGWENRVARLPGLRRAESGLALLLPRLRMATALRRGVRTHTVPHHEAHAWSALFGRDEGPALIATWDAYGEGLAATCRPAEAPGAPTSRLGVDVGLARVYGAVTQGLGFSEGDEGKVMGRAARGDARLGIQRFRALFDVRDGVPRLRGRLRRSAVAELLAGLSVEDAAAALQLVTEELAEGWVSVQLRTFQGPRRLLLAGGLFANIRVNQRLAEMAGSRGIFVFPNMVDGGLSAGAAAHTWARVTGGRPGPLTTAALGIPPTEGAMMRAATSSGLSWRRVDDPARRAAEHLRRGRVVCWYEGRDEFGPRALGQRSILFPATASHIGDRVNTALGRDPFMPFGPILAEEDLPSLARTSLSAADLAWMTVAVDARERLKETCPAAVHVDGTTRPQVVGPRRAPGMHDLLRHYGSPGGPAAVINTSFNLHGEPIVHTPADAVRTFRAARLDVLFLGDIEIVREGQPS